MRPSVLTLALKSKYKLQFSERGGLLGCLIHPVLRVDVFCFALFFLESMGRWDETVSVMTLSACPLEGGKNIHVQSMNFHISNERHYFCSQVQSDYQYNDSRGLGEMRSCFMKTS